MEGEREGGKGGKEGGKKRRERERGKKGRERGRNSIYYVCYNGSYRVLCAMYCEDCFCIYASALLIVL